MRVGTIVSWKLPRTSLKRVVQQAELARYIRRPSPADLRIPLERYLMREGVLSQHGMLALRYAPSKGWALYLIETDPFLLTPTIRLYAVVSCYPFEVDKRFSYEPDAPAVLSKFEPEIAAGNLCHELVKQMLRSGCVRLRRKGGVYFVPYFLEAQWQPVLNALARIGDVRQFHVEVDDEMITNEIVNTAIMQFSDEIATLKAGRKTAWKQARIAELELLIKQYETLSDIAHRERELDKAVLRMV